MENATVADFMKCNQLSAGKTSSLNRLCVVINELHYDLFNLTREQWIAIFERLHYGSQAMIERALKAAMEFFEWSEKEGVENKGVDPSALKLRLGIEIQAIQPIYFKDFDELVDYIEQGMKYSYRVMSNYIRSRVTILLLWYGLTYNDCVDILREDVVYYDETGITIEEDKIIRASIQVGNTVYDVENKTFAKMLYQLDTLVAFDPLERQKLSESKYLFRTQNGQMTAASLQAEMQKWLAYFNRRLHENLTQKAVRESAQWYLLYNIMTARRAPLVFDQTLRPIFETICGVHYHSTQQFRLDFIKYQQYLEATRPNLF